MGLRRERRKVVIAEKKRESWQGKKIKKRDMKTVGLGG